MTKVPSPAGNREQRPVAPPTREQRQGPVTPSTRESGTGTRTGDSTSQGTETGTSISSREQGARNRGGSKSSSSSGYQSIPVVRQERVPTSWRPSRGLGSHVARGRPGFGALARDAGPVGRLPHLGRGAAVHEALGHRGEVAYGPVCRECVSQGRSCLPLVVREGEEGGWDWGNKVLS